MTGSHVLTLTACTAARRTGWLLASALLAVVTAGASEPGPVSPAARLPQGDEAWEHWDVVAEFESGHRLFARFLITNAGPGERNAVALGHVIDPDGGPTLRFKNGRTRDEWELSTDRRRLDVGSSHLHLDETGFRLFVTKTAVNVDLRFAAPHRIQVDASGLPEGYGVDLLAGAAPFSGTMQLKGMSAPQAVKGHLAIVHSWGSRAEAELVRRRIDFFAPVAKSPLWWMEVMTPDGKRVVKLAGPDKKVRSITQSSELPALDGHAPGERDDDYWVPAAITLDSDEVSGQFELSSRLLADDPMGAIPLPMRLLTSRGSQPMRVWAATSFHVTFFAGPGTHPLPTRGPGVTVLSFLNPVP